MEHDNEPSETQDVCFLALTRPAMFLGVPMEAFAFIGMATTVVFIAFDNIFYAGFGVVFWLIARAIVWEDHNRFGVIAAWLDTAGVQRNKDYWGGSSVSPAPLLPTYSVEDDAHV